MPADQRSVVLSRYLALAWLGLIVYGSLHPFSGWQDNGQPVLAFLENAWPRYWTAFDLMANVAVYAPLGFFLTLTLRRLPGRHTPLLLAVLLAGSLSLGLEALQNWLPSRVPSNLDLACNTLGGLLGAAGARAVGPGIFQTLSRLEHFLMARVPHAELGITLLALWLLVPLSPEILLFGTGDLRQIAGFTPPVAFSPTLFPIIETAVTACNLITVGLLIRHLAARAWMAALLVPLFIALGLAIRALSETLLVGTTTATPWLTTGAWQGIAVAAGVLLITLWLPATIRLWLATMTLLAGILLVNLAPTNPYSAAALAAWQQGHFLNFNGLTRLVAAAWPFLALPFLLVSRPRR